MKSLIDFYEDVIARTPNMDKYGRWKSGAARKMASGVIDLARHKGKQSVNLYADNTGWTDFYIFEYDSTNR